MAEACHPGDPQPQETKEEGERTHLRTFHQPGINHNATLPLIEIVLFFQCSTASPSIANCRHASSHDDQRARCATFEANQRSYWPRSYSTEDCAAPHTCAEQGRWQRQGQGAFARHSAGQAGGPAHSEPSPATAAAVPAVRCLCSQRCASLPSRGCRSG